MLAMEEAPQATPIEPPLGAQAEADGLLEAEQATAVPANFAIDPDARYAGTIAFFSKLRGYGFIQVANKGVVPEDRIFVQWRDIRSQDRYPFLVTDMEVEFGLLKRRSAMPGQVTLRAKEVTMPGGGYIHVQDELDAAEKCFVGGQSLRYSGVLKFYNPRAGYGYIAVENGSVEADDAIPSQLRVERSEVNAGGEQPKWMQDVVVEFGIWKTPKDIPKAYNVTLPGGIPLTQAALENRQAVGGQTYCGEVTMWNWKQGWGFIKPDPSVRLPPHVQAKLAQQTQAAITKARERGRPGSDEELLYVRTTDVAPGVRLEKGLAVMYQVYLDDKGVGAYQVQTV